MLAVQAVNIPEVYIVHQYRRSRFCFTRICLYLDLIKLHFMNHENLSKLASLLNEAHGSGEFGFIVAPLEDAVIRQHQHAMSARDTIFNYQPEANEHLGISAVTRVNAGDTARPDYAVENLAHIPYEHMITDQNEHLMKEYLEYMKSRPNRYA